MNNSNLNSSININSIKSLEEIMGGSKICLILEKYIESSTEIIKGLHEASEKNEAAHIMRHAHSLKSSSMQVGATTLGSLCQELEEASQKDNFILDHNSITNIEKEFNIVAADIKVIINNYQTK